MDKACKVCGEHPGEEGLSKRGLCEACELRRMTEAARQMAAKEGPYYERWKVGRAEAKRSRTERSKP